MKRCDKGFWQRSSEVLMAELYEEFVPRWFRRKMRVVPDYELKTLLAWLSPSLKFGLGVGLYPLLATFNFGNYANLTIGVAAYLVADAIYQFLDLRYPYKEGFRKAATLAVDLFTYPFYLILLQAQHESGK